MVLRNPIGALESGRAHVVAALAIAVLTAGLALWWNASRVPRATLPSASTAPVDTTSDGTIERALDLAGRDSSIIKSRWHAEIAGVDLAPLSPAQREIFIRFANAERCTCGCGYTLAGCRASDMSCEVSGPHIAALFDSVRSGRIRSARGVRERPSGGG